MNESNDFGFEPEDNNEFDFIPEEIYQKSNQKKESFGENLKRNVARSGARAAETIAGLPGDLLDLTTKAVMYGAEKIGGQPISEEFKSTLKETAPFKLLPTSSSLREKTAKLSGGYTEPKTESEELGDEVTQLASAIFTPGKDPSKFKSLVTGLGKALGKSGAAIGAKETAKGFGATPGQQSAAEMGTLLLTSLVKPGAANKYAATLYKDAQAQVPKGATIKTGKLLQDLAKTESELLKGETTATKKKVLDSLENLKTKASKGKISPTELTDFYKDINETLSSKNLFDQFGGMSKLEQKLLRQRYDLIRNDIRNTLKEYGKVNPKFYNSWSKANEVYSTVAQSRNAMNFIKKHANKGYLSLIGEAVAFPEAVLPTAGALGVGVAGVKSGEIIYRISKSPELRKFYSDSIKFALEENIPAMNQSLKKLNDGVKSLELN